MTLVAASAALAAASCGRPLSDEECRRLLDRYTEHLVRAEDPKASPESVAHLQEAARAAARREPRFEFSKCPRRVSRREYDCAMNAPDVDAIERCLMF